MNAWLWWSLGFGVAGPVIGIPLAKLGSRFNACVVLWLAAAVLFWVGLAKEFL